MRDQRAADRRIDEPAGCRGSADRDVQAVASNGLTEVGTPPRPARRMTPSRAETGCTAVDQAQLGGDTIDRGLQPDARVTATTAVVPSAPNVAVATGAGRRSIRIRPRTSPAAGS